MFLALNTFVYEVARSPIRETLDSAKRLGFTFVDYAAYRAGDPTLVSDREQAEIVKMFKDNGLQCSQMLLVNTQHLASPDVTKRNQTMEHMKRCTDFLLRLGGRQALVCWGSGMYEPNMLREQAWVNMVSMLREYAEWGLDKGILVNLELTPHVYFIINDTHKMAKAIEDVAMPNIFPNIDIGHLCLTKENPATMEKFKGRILHVHLSETDTFIHTNSILGTGNADLKAYMDKVLELGIEDTCKQHKEACVAGIELADISSEVDDPERWVKESLSYVEKILPDLKT